MNFISSSFLRQSPVDPQLQLRQATSNRKASSQLPKSLSLKEVELALDMRWSKKFMPREFA
ncbi:hypothetical protein [Pseudanabaena sp. Chao 1811]|uniref:hypothetical protein n=1 Tax=Pseudanabaena sp. Chao 1811 TaxID=2963092 RepID=UPI0022F37E85|nr:hypothetical protein [Pseudanabaena sp. Chao 1811]